MRWPRWIAATLLISQVLPVCAAPPASRTADEPSASSLVPAPQELLSSTTTTKPATSDEPSFQEELEQLQQEIAATKALHDVLKESAKIAPDQPVDSVSDQRRDLMELLTKLATKNLTPKPATVTEKPRPAMVTTTPPAPMPAATKPPAPQETPAKAVTRSETAPAKPEPHALITDKILDPYALGRALFRAGDFVGAEQAFRKVPLSDDNRVLVQYLIATCLRKQARWTEAAKAFRVVAESNEDPALRDLAKWQLDNIRWYQQTDTQLEKLRKMREKAGGSLVSPKTAGERTVPQ